MNKNSYLIILIFSCSSLTGCGKNANEELSNVANHADLYKVQQTISRHEANDPEPTDQNGLTPLMRASLDGHAAVVKKLIANGADVNHQDKNGLTALHLAAQKGYLDVVQELLPYASVDIIDSTGWPALLVAIQNGNVDIVKAILSKAPSLNIQYAGVTPLYIAVQNQNERVVQLLLSKGADVEQPTKIGETPIELAQDRGYVEIYDLLMAKKHN